MACQSESNRSPANLASIQFRDYTADLLVFLDAERERLAAEITQAQAEIEASLSFF
jgi:multidrug efflux system outer membrane protein